MLDLFLIHYLQRFDKVYIDLVDYRDLESKGLMFNRIVSVGMIEHVGRSNYSFYMETANQILRD